MKMDVTLRLGSRHGTTVTVNWSSVVPPTDEAQSSGSATTFIVQEYFAGVPFSPGFGKVSVTKYVVVPGGDGRSGEMSHVSQGPLFTKTFIPSVSPECSRTVTRTLPSTL